MHYHANIYLLIKWKIFQVFAQVQQIFFIANYCPLYIPEKLSFCLSIAIIYMTSRKTKFLMFSFLLFFFYQNIQYSRFLLFIHT
jgi:hypothetical protein